MKKPLAFRCSNPPNKLHKYRKQLFLTHIKPIKIIPGNCLCENNGKPLEHQSWLSQNQAISNQSNGLYSIQKVTKINIRKISALRI